MKAIFIPNIVIKNNNAINGVTKKKKAPFAKFFVKFFSISLLCFTTTFSNFFINNIPTINTENNPNVTLAKTFDLKFSVKLFLFSSTTFKNVILPPTIELNYFVYLMIFLNLHLFLNY